MLSEGHISAAEGAHTLEKLSCIAQRLLDQVVQLDQQLVAEACHIILFNLCNSESQQHMAVLRGRYSK